MQRKDNSKSKGLKERLPRVGWSWVGASLLDLAEKCELYSTCHGS